MVRSIAVHHGLGAGVTQGALDGTPPVDPAVPGAEIAVGEMVDRLLYPRRKRARLQ
jgi:hypothetical protein